MNISARARRVRMVKLAKVMVLAVTTTACRPALRPVMAAMATIICRPVRLRATHRHRNKLPFAGTRTRRAGKIPGGIQSAVFYFQLTTGSCAGMAERGGNFFTATNPASTHRPAAARYGECGNSA